MIEVNGNRLQTPLKITLRGDVYFLRGDFAAAAAVYCSSYEIKI
jgi:hypothetical protein